MRIIIPKRIGEKELIKHNTKIQLKLQKVTNIADTFGKLKRQVSGQKFKDETRSGW